MANNAYIVAKAFESKGRLSRIYDLECYYKDTDLNVTFDNGWRALREQIWFLYEQFPFAKIFPYLLPYKRITDSPTEALTSELLNSMETNLYYMYQFINYIEYNNLPIKLTKELQYQKLTKKWS